MSSTAPNGIVWGFAERQDVGALQRFVCTDPPRAEWDLHRSMVHPAPWELEVQSYIRNLQPHKLPRSEAVLLGVVGDEIVAVTHFCFDVEEENLMVLAIAVHVDYRGRGYGREALRQALDVIDQTRLENGLKGYTMTRIHPSNKASRALFSGAGFTCLGDIESSGLDIWTAY